MKQIQEWLGHSTYNTTADIYAHLDYSSKIASANVISGVLDFENNSNLSDKEILENEIAELEKQLKEKKKLRKTKDFEMWKRHNNTQKYLLKFVKIKQHKIHFVRNPLEIR